MLRCAVCCHVQNMHYSWSIQVHHITNIPCGNVYKRLDPCPQKIHQDTPLYTGPDAGRSLPYTLELEDRQMKDKLRYTVDGTTASCNGIIISKHASKAKLFWGNIAEHFLTVSKVNFLLK